MEFVVYKFKNKSNGKLYIGKTIDGLKIRVANHIYDARNGSSTLFARALRKYGLDGFEVEVVFVGCCELDILKEERRLIELYKSNDPVFGYNLTNGGEGQIPNEIVRRKLSRIIKNHYKNPHRIEKQRGQNNGRSVLSEKQVLAIRLLYWRRLKNRRELSVLFSSTKQIESILRRKTWAHLPKLEEEQVELWDRELSKFTYLTAEQMTEVRNLSKSGFTQQNIACMFRCSQSYIGNILRKSQQ